MALKGAGWRVDLRGVRELRLSLRKLEVELLDLRPFWRDYVLPLVPRWVNRQFKSQGVYFLGTPWLALSPRYAAWKAEHHPGRGILVARGVLRRSALNAASYEVTYTPRGMKARLVRWRGPGGRQLDPAWHQEGTRHMPARPILPILATRLPPDARAELDRAAEEYLEDLVSRAIERTGPGSFRVRPLSSVIPRRGFSLARRFEP